jgi:hypothetical protein
VRSGHGTGGHHGGDKGREMHLVCWIVESCWSCWFLVNVTRTVAQ